MAYSPDTINKVRANYIKGMTLKAAAAAVSVPYETVRAWKRKADVSGDDWDHARAALRVSKGGAQELTAAVIEDFIHTFQATIEAVKNDKKITPLQRAQTLSQLSDAYQKTVKAMGDSNPKLSQLSVAMDVLQRLTLFIREHHPEAIQYLINILDGFGAELARVYR